MNMPARFQADADAMPPVLRELLEAELAAGNEVVEVSHTHPAPPVGACFKLARPVTTRPRATGGGLDFFDRNSSLYSGEFTDAQRFFFIVEPPNPPPPEPDMNAIRAEWRAKQAARDADEIKNPNRSQTSGRIEHARSPVPTTSPRRQPPTAVERFQESMVMTYERWHDGIGYDLEILKTASPEELVEIENLLVGRGISDWRDVEALAELNSPRARLLLRKALKSSKAEMTTAVLRHAPDLASEAERTRILVEALGHASFYEGLSETLRQVEEFHPPEVMEALLRGVRERAGETAVHFAAMLMFLHGRAKSSFDWDLRPFFLRFNTDDSREREQAVRELRERLGLPD